MAISLPAKQIYAGSSPVGASSFNQKNVGLTLYSGVIKSMKAENLTEKKCKSCFAIKPIEYFYPQKAYNKEKTYNTWDCNCKECRIKISTKRRQKIKREAILYLGGKCEDCGENRDIPSIYDFHHKDPNQKDFSIGKQAKSFESIKKELDKCSLLCAVCHRIRHSHYQKEVGLEAAMD